MTRKSYKLPFNDVIKNNPQKYVDIIKLNLFPEYIHPYECETPLARWASAISGSVSRHKSTDTADSRLNYTSVNVRTLAHCECYLKKYEKRKPYFL